MGSRARAKGRGRATVKVAAVQVQSRNGAAAANLANATRHVEEAARRGAQLAVCPEFLAPGYVFEESIWDAAERQDGPTESWLRELATRFGIHVGAGYLETDGSDFFNTFTLMTPSGKPAGRVRKGSLPVFEGWYFTPDRESSKIVSTELGRIGVGICNDNQTCWFLRAMTRDRPDLLVMPHSAPSPRPPLPIVGRWIKESLREQTATVSLHYATTLGVPVVFVNKTASHSTTTLPLVPWMRVSWEFDGRSLIRDGEGRVLTQLGAEEGVAVAEVTPGAIHEPRVSEPSHFYWSFTPPRLADPIGRLMLGLETLGKASYRRNPRRTAAARRHR